MAEPVTPSGPLTVVVTWQVRQGREQEFEAWRRDISAAARRFPGHLGSEVIPPCAKPGEYVVLFRFDTYEHLRAWQESAVHGELLQKADSFRESAPSYRTGSGLEYWFSPPGVAQSPPRWKMALVTVLGVWPVSILVSWLLMPLIGRQPPVWQALFMAVGIVLILTWVVMPLLVRIFKPWLNKIHREQKS